MTKIITLINKTMKYNKSKQFTHYFFLFSLLWRSREPIIISLSYYLSIYFLHTYITAYTITGSKVDI